MFCLSNFLLCIPKANKEDEPWQHSASYAWPTTLSLTHTKGQFCSSDPAWPPSRSSLLPPCTLFENLSKLHNCVQTWPSSLLSHPRFLSLVLLQVTQLPPYSSQKCQGAGSQRSSPSPTGTGCSVHTSFQNPVLSASVIPAVADGFVSGLESFLSWGTGLSSHTSTFSRSPLRSPKVFQVCCLLAPTQAQVSPLTWLQSCDEG